MTEGAGVMNVSTAGGALTTIRFTERPINEHQDTDGPGSQH